MAIDTLALYCCLDDFRKLFDEWGDSVDHGDLGFDLHPRLSGR